MYYECCVCKNSRQDAILHHFPSTEKRLIKWLKCLNRDDLKEASPEQISKLFVCQKHFEKRFITSKNRLTCKAYPTLFAEDEICSGIPSKENTENVDPQAEHSYSRKRHLDHTYCRAEPLKEAIVPACSEFQGTSHLLPMSIDSGIPVDAHCIAADGIDNIPRSAVVHKDTHVKASKNSRKRLIKKIKNLTPTTKMVYREYIKSKRQTDFFRRANRALKFSKEKSFEKLTKDMNPFAKKIMNMQINLCQRNKHGRRFTNEEKLIALSIMKQSPKCYRFLHKIFVLPSRTTLNKMVAKLNIQTGISPQVFALIKKEVTAWDDKKKMCSVVFDEMSLETALTYDKNKDAINGFVELNEKKNEFADHALVFMLRGAVYKWQQPVAFYYCQGATSGVQLKTILKDVISAVVECGLKPIALICDQGTAFQSAIKSLRDDTKREQILANEEPDETITICGASLNIIYDPSHLIKGIRNNFLTKDINIDGKISKWRDIMDVYETDCNHTEARLLHKLNDQHVIPEKIKKMKVKNCTKVFSNTVSAALLYTANFSHYADGRPVSSTIKNTAETVKFLDCLFDSINGASTFSKKNKGKILRTAVSEKSPHHEFWLKAIEKLEKLKFVDSTGKEKQVPSIKNFIITLKSYMRLWQLFKGLNIKIMRPRYFNSDPIENFFGQVRAYNYRSNDPSCHSFNCTFKSLLITRIIKFHNETFNCEDDPADHIINLQLLFDAEKKDTVAPDHPTIEQPNVEMIVDQARRERMTIHSRAYTAGWVVRKIFEKKQIDCDTCKRCLTTNEKSNIHDWISHREYTAARNRLNYPSEGAVRCFGTVVMETNEYLEHQAHKNGISGNIKALLLSKYSFDFINCTEHKDIVLNHFITLTVRFSVLNWCNIINKILKGTDLSRLRNRVLPPMQNMAYEKYKKKLKNKSFNK